MKRILDYDALFNERGEQANICTDADVGGDYACKNGIVQTVVRKAPDGNAALSEGRGQLPETRIRLRPVRYVDFDTFAEPERTVEEARECLQKTVLLFGGLITAVVAIAILI